MRYIIIITLQDELPTIKLINIAHEMIILLHVINILVAINIIIVYTFPFPSLAYIPVLLSALHICMKNDIHIIIICSGGANNHLNTTS